MKNIGIPIALACAVAATLAAPSAQAQAPEQTDTASTSPSFAGQATLGGLLGLGVGFSGGGTYLGLGGRGGYTLPMNLYVGGAATFNIHLGTGSAYFLMVAGECGYDIGVGPVIIRPYGGLGFGVAIVSVPEYIDPYTGMSTGGTQTDGRFLIKFGGELLVPIGTSLFVGGDMNIAILPGSGSETFWNLLGTFGARFGGPS